jgi:hypothetical protein
MDEQQNKGMTERWAPATDATERGYANDPGFTSGEYAVDRRYGDEPRSEEPTERRTAEIRSDIEQTRAEMGETIDAIQERLRPGQVASRAVESVREAAKDKVRQVTQTVQHALPGHRSSATQYAAGSSRGRLNMTSQWGDTSRSGGGFMNRLVENPVATVLAAGSLAWLAFNGSRSRQQHHYAPAIYGSTRDGEAFIRETRIDVDADELGEDASGATWNASSGMSGVADSARRMASDAGSSAQHALDTTRLRARRMTQGNPLAAAGVATVIGLAIGLALPETDRENELMGEARDSMIDRARGAARDAAGRVQDAAQQVQRVAGDAVAAVTDSKTTDRTGA